MSAWQQLVHKLCQAASAGLLPMPMAKPANAEPQNPQGKGR